MNWTWEEEKAARDRDSKKEIAKYTRLLRLAEMNGIRVKIVERHDLHWRTWWMVPPMWVPMVGAMMAAVDLSQ